MQPGGYFIMPSEMVVIWGSFVDMTIYVFEIKLVVFSALKLFFFNVFVFYSGSVGYITSYEVNFSQLATLKNYHPKEFF